MNIDHFVQDVFCVLKSKSYNKFLPLNKFLIL